MYRNKSIKYFQLYKRINIYAFPHLVYPEQTKSDDMGTPLGMDVTSTGTGRNPAPVKHHRYIEIAFTLTLSNILGDGPTEVKTCGKMMASMGMNYHTPLIVNGHLRDIQGE